MCAHRRPAPPGRQPSTESRSRPYSCHRLVGIRTSPTGLPTMENRPTLSKESRYSGRNLDVHNRDLYDTGRWAIGFVAYNYGVFHVLYYVSIRVDDSRISWRYFIVTADFIVYFYTQSTVYSGSGWLRLHVDFGELCNYFITLEYEISKVEIEKITLSPKIFPNFFLQFFQKNSLTFTENFNDKNL